MEKEQSRVVARVFLSSTREQVALSCAGVSREGGREQEREAGKGRGWGDEMREGQRRGGQRRGGERREMKERDKREKGEGRKG